MLEICCYLQLLVFRQHLNGSSIADCKSNPVIVRAGYFAICWVPDEYDYINADPKPT